VVKVMKLEAMLLAALSLAGVPLLAPAPPRPVPFSPAVPVARPGSSDDDLTAILQLVHQTNPTVPASRAARIASLIVDTCRARQLDPFILAGIIAQESHFHASAERCQDGFCDLGLGQVNWETWHRALGLDRGRLIHDDAYNIAVAAGILSETRARFGEGASWWTRYHDQRPDRRLSYGQLVRAHAPALFGRI
jgi:hypothetical protein